MKILHTSDWHIGRLLYGIKRYEEFEAFLEWLSETIQQNTIEALLVAGDIFDTTTPSNRSQELYYWFLCRVFESRSCRHVVVIAGNHDSPSFLNAPKELLKALNVHVVGSSTESPEDEVLVLYDKQNNPELIVCAVPYLRDKDIRVAEAGESIEDKEKKLNEGIRTHYASVAALAEQKRVRLGVDIPIIGMGHLFTAGGQTIDGDGVRELYVGSMVHISTEIFPENFDYLALGHLHVPQKVHGSEKIRYSGSPLPMGFGEARQQKIICQVEFNGRAVSIQHINVPVFQKIERVKGDLNCILSRIRELATAGEQSWLEVIYNGSEIITDLNERLYVAVSGTQLKIIRAMNTRESDHILMKTQEGESLDDLNVDEVFERCLAAHEVLEAQRPELLCAYHETISSINEDDVQAE